MHINHRYLLRKAQQICKTRDARILDFGCGKAETVEAGRRMKLDIYGAEMFYAGGDRRKFVEEKGLLGDAVRVIENGRVPFPDNHFDLVFSNYVLEHVEDLNGVVTEIQRLLKPGGYYLSLFPTRDVWREGHCGIPLLHRFSPRSRVRFYYALGLRRLGLGHHKDGKSPVEWTRDFLDYLDRWTHYRDRATVLQTFRQYFAISLVEEDYIMFRLAAGRLKLLSPLMRFGPTKSIGCELYRRLAGLVVLAQKPVSPGVPSSTVPSLDSW